MRFSTLNVSLIATLVALLPACNSSPAAAPPGMGGGERPPGEVGVVTLKTESITLQAELSGRTTASLASDIRPQVTGILKARTFVEGAKVKAGQVLYEIDPSMYRASYAEAQADLESSKATLESAKLKDQRFTALAKIEGVSKQEAEDAHAAFQLAQAGVAQRLAALEVSRINLSYTAILAPIGGRIGKSAVTPGALVTASQAQPLATIRSLDPIYVDLTESSEDRLRLRAQLGAGKLQAGTTKVKLKLSDGSLYDKEGTLEFSEVAVDESTGTVTLRATFPNPDDVLLPGMYVRAVLDQAVDTTAILAPQQGIMRDPKGNAVAMVASGVDPKSGVGKVEPRTLIADRAIGDRWLVSSGLNDGDKLIIEGLNKIGPGMPVHASEVKPHAADAEAARALGSVDASAGAPAGDKPAAKPPETSNAAGSPAKAPIAPANAAPTAPTAAAPSAAKPPTGAPAAQGSGASKEH